MQKELVRLKHAFQIGERQRIFALAGQAAKEAELHAARQLLASGKNGHELPHDASALEDRKQHAIARVSDLVSRIAAHKRIPYGEDMLFKVALPKQDMH
eukprot:scaffold215459_cov16-Prasinocladus_malaysianus.AAC.1